MAFPKDSGHLLPSWTLITWTFCLVWQWWNSHKTIRTPYWLPYEWWSLHSKLQSPVARARPDATLMVSVTVKEILTIIVILFGKLLLVVVVIGSLTHRPVSQPAMDEGDSSSLSLLLRCVRLERIHGNVALFKKEPLPMLTSRTRY